MQKVLIITYYWPPAGGPGVQRWLKFVKYLPDFGITPVLYIPEKPNYPIVDQSFVNEVPKGITIYKHRIREPYGLARMFSRKKARRISSGIIHTENQSLIEKVMLWIRGNFFIPDARKNWVKPSVKRVSGILEKENIDTIITTGPPHSVHLIGYHLKQQIGIKWIADFRDPWTSIGYHKKLKLTVKSQRKHKKLEHLVLNAADKIVVTSKTTKKEFQGITDKSISVITNGYDSDYEGDAILDSKFTISHIGSLLSGRNPENLWKVLAELILENEQFARNFKLQLAGVVSDDVLHSIYASGLKNNMELIGYVSHKEALKIQRESQILLLVEINSRETTGILPGKLYEYLAARRPILAVGPSDWDASAIITETKSGAFFNYISETHLKNVILEWFDAFQKNSLNLDSTELEKYSRRGLTGELSKLL
jgi:hypothetical protein